METKISKPVSTQFADCWTIWCQAQESAGIFVLSDQGWVISDMARPIFEIFDDGILTFARQISPELVLYVEYIIKFKADIAMSRNTLPVIYPEEPPTPEDIRAIRLWHWDVAMYYRALYQEAQRNNEPDRENILVHYDSLVSLHIGAVQKLNDVVDGVAEYERLDRNRMRKLQ